MGAPPTSRPAHHRPAAFGPLSDRLFLRFSRYIQEELGIKMPPAKRTMLQARLQKRLRKLGMRDFEQYYEFVFSPEGQRTELPNLIDAVTTNKTDFFREAQHFTYLTTRVLPELTRESGAGIERPAHFWSAGCSTGEEPYTLAMVLSEYRMQQPRFAYSILGTDISGEVLRTAAAGIYAHEKIAPVPMPLRKRYLLKSRDSKKDLVRVVSELRGRVEFRRVNFMSRDLGIRRTMDVVFCRNVLIYFDRDNQEAVLNRICRHLRSGGYLFTGHSETLNGLDVPLRQKASTVYRKIG